jgi:hypothetical protein
MRVRVAGLAMAMVLVLANVCPAGKFLFQDKFTTLEPFWGYASATLQAKDGRLVISPEPSTTRTILNQATVLPNDVEASVTMTFIKAATPTWGSGLVFWAKDYSAYYAVLINAQGWVAVQRHLDDRYLLPVGWRQSDAIKTGEGAENIITVLTKGTQATITINGKEVISCVGEPPPGGSLIGFKGASGPDGLNSVAFANLQVMQPS